MKSEEERILVGETEEEAEINEIKSHALVDDAGYFVYISLGVW